MTSLTAVAIRQMMNEERDRDSANRRFLERIRNAPDRGTKGKIRWSREELHQRGIR